MLAPTGYVPGTCNIGRDEIRRRRRSGYLGLGFTAILFAILHLSNAGPAWFALLLLPAAATAIGLLQAQARFCVYYGLAALFNFGDLSSVERVSSPHDMARDKAMARQLIFLAAAIAIGVTALAIVSAITF